jgi:steroid delta-isomerase-like uncharacterized protein
MGSSEDNEAVVRACFDVGTHGNFEALDAILSPDFVLHDGSAPDVRGVEGARAVVEAYRNGVPDLRVTIEQQFSDGDYVATRWTVHGTHGGEIMGVPATGRELTLTGITISRCRDGRIVEEWEVSDTMGLLQQVGAFPQPVES